MTASTALPQIRSHAGLRGIAALLVVTYHLQFGVRTLLPFEQATSFFARSYLMVDLFFVLSGFIISYVNRGNRDGPMRGAETRDFLLRRMIRLYPLHLFAMLMTIATTLFLGAYWWHRGVLIDDLTPYGLAVLAGQLLLLNAWMPDPNGWNVPTWSISAEMFAYAMFPLIVTAQARARGATRIALLLLPLGFYAWILARGGSLDIIGDAIAPFRCLAGFMLGCLAFQLRDVAGRLGEGVLGLLQGAALAGIVLGLAIPVADPLLVPAFFILVWTSAQDRGLPAGLLSCRPLLWLGEISYSVYLIHVPIIHALRFVWTRVVAAAGLELLTVRPFWLLLAIATVIVCSWFTYRFVEVPARIWLTKRLKGRRPPPIALSPSAP